MNSSMINYFIVNKNFLRDIVLNKAFQFMKEKFKRSIDKRSAFGALLTAYQELLIALITRF